MTCIAQSWLKLAIKPPPPQPGTLGTRARSSGSPYGASLTVPLLLNTAIYSNISVHTSLISSSKHASGAHFYPERPLSSVLACARATPTPSRSCAQIRLPSPERDTSSAAMGRSKPRTNKRPPPKPSRANGSAGTSPVQPSAPAASVVGHAHHHHHSPAPIHFDPVSSLFPPPSTLDPTDPNFPAAFQSWSTSALNQINQLGQLPRLTPAQLSAIAGAAAGMSDGGLLAAAGQEDCVGLPQSLAGLFEAKLTLDREKTKLQRVQKELSGFRDGNWSAAGPAPVGAPPPMPTIKGKEVAALVADDDDLAECTCGRNG